MRSLLGRLRQRTTLSCTIEPNTGIVAVPDTRLSILSGISKSAKVIPTTIEFVDIAGLVKGCFKKEKGLEISSWVIFVQLMRLSILFVALRMMTSLMLKEVLTPERDIDLIETELLLSDLASVERRLEKSKKGLKAGGASAKEAHEILLKAQELLNDGKNLRSSDPEVVSQFLELDLITAKPVLFVGNVSEDGLSEQDDYQKSLIQAAENRGANCIFLSGQVESELASLESEERAEFLAEMGIAESGFREACKSRICAITPHHVFHFRRKRNKSVDCHHQRNCC